MAILLCPGQGAQRPGMLLPWLEVPGVRSRLETWSDAVNLDLVAHGTQSPAEVLADTAITQPLLTATALASFQAWRHQFPETPIEAVAGHSVGEFAAAAIAGVMSELDAMVAVTARGRAMARCAAAQPTKLAAVVGGEPDAVLDAIAAAGASPANFNGPGQIVAGGTVEALERLAAAPPARTRVVMLDVAGAFHTEFMTPARQDLAQVMAPLAAQDAAIPLVANADGALVTNGQDVVDRLIAQVDRPVRWDLVQRTISLLAPQRVTELAPAGVLTGLAKRGLKGISVTAVAEPAGVSSAPTIPVATNPAGDTALNPVGATA